WTPQSSRPSLPRSPEGEWLFAVAVRLESRGPATTVTVMPMTRWKKTFASVLTGTAMAASTVVGAGALTVVTAGSAEAAGHQYSVGPFATKADCNATKRQYISSFTKISQACTYYPKQGGFTANGWYF